ncbi:MULTISPECIES: glucan ABC transporter ATP-binding protein/ permease [Brucella/Ochrobactrum group]|uniref:Glucan ABC transporter ATP-binding protein/ permease n=1 Tax=Brucella pseudintermedia TaxID=370111 RepID=A0ABY5UBS8_9HYPH|nr:MULTISPECIES: glucan ABC transporter ATP-binding protein/ permease [Brucella/Ochrobactrum group]MCO7726203.1 glucan ABC transporter ATP-binding protein/ permease [Brucella intermedia]NKE77166.1 glucan ABC transporter ATP-binding protein/ permease [Ochrobactrum sp. MC-1LL]KAB2683979.1 glucan ABC transporter ATP-binding protein/ permease [Brucella pseudintermedia]TWH03721.1 ATP-binding cassette subfamily B protein [Ochrobactrum sp. J50]UWL60791.1 glucan ABC transporter ATP-binding protein/ pe
MSLLKIYWRAMEYLAVEKAATITMCVASVLVALVTLAEPILFGRVIQAISDRGDIFSPLAMWAALGGFNIVAAVFVARGADRLAHRRRLGVMIDSYERLITMPLSWHQKRGTSNALHTLIRATDSLFTLWLEFMRQHLTTIVALATLIPVAMNMDMRMSLVLIVLGVIYVMIGQLVMRKTKDGQTAVEKHHHKLFEHVSDTISNVSVVQSYNRIASETQSLRDYAKNLEKAQFPVLNWWALASGLNRMASTFSMVVVLVLGAYFVTKGQMRVGDVIAFIGFAQLMIGRLDQISAFINQTVTARAKLEEFFQMEDATADRQEPQDVSDLTDVKGDIVFDNVTFEFPNSGQGVYDVSFEIKPGQTVAIVGPTGAGKTTLINLLQRVFDPAAGRITIDGTDTRTVSRRSLRHAIATVFQDAGLFNRSVEENIRVGREDATSEEVHAAARAAAAHDFILAKSDGYDTVVGERGSQLSGGERQRLAIARAILKDSPILVLDEATSALDVETEEKVKQAVDDLSHNRTTFIIAHRLSTVRSADLVLFMDKGHLVESGSFDELAARGGRFTDLLRAGGLKLEDKATKAVEGSNVMPFPTKGAVG